MNIKGARIFYIHFLCIYAYFFDIKYVIKYNGAYVLIYLLLKYTSPPCTIQVESIHICHSIQCILHSVSKFVYFKSPTTIVIASLKAGIGPAIQAGTIPASLLNLLKYEKHLACRLSPWTNHVRQTAWQPAVWSFINLAFC